MVNCPLISINGKKSWDWGTCWAMPSNSHSPYEPLWESIFFHHHHHHHHQQPISLAGASCTAWNSELLEIRLCPMDSKLQPYSYWKKKKKSDPIRIDSSLKDVNQIQQAQYSTNFTEPDGFWIEVGNCRT